MIYTEHPLSKKLKDSLISDYNPKWIRNNSNERVLENITKEKSKNLNKKLSWETF